MDRRKSFRFASPIIVWMAAALFADAAAASTVWQNDWTYTAPSYLSSGFSFQGPTAPVAYSGDGDVLFAGINRSPFNAQVTRLDSAGNLRWVSNLDNYSAQDYYQANALIANDDGSAFVALGGIPGSRIARLDPNGALVWMRNLPSRWMTKLPGGKLALGDCTRISVIDANSGDLLWERRTVPSSYCGLGGLPVDSLGNIYQVFYAADVVHVQKFDVDGNLTYETTGGTTFGEQVGAIVGIDGTNFYVRVGADLRAFRLSDGGLAWTIQPESFDSGIASGDTPSELVLVGTDSIRRLAADTGVERWSKPLTNGHFARSAGGSILVNADSSLIRLNAATGTTVWSLPLPAVDDAGDPLYWQQFGGLANNHIIGIAGAYPVNKAAPPFVQTIDFSSGSLLPRAPVPLVAQGVDATSKVYGTQIVSVAHNSSATGPKLRIRSVDAGNGGTQWETVDDMPLGDQFFTPGQPAYFAIEDDVIAVVSTLTRPVNLAPPESGFQIGLYDRATGSKQWSVTLNEPTQAGTNSVGPEIDADGNVYAAVEIDLACGASTCSHTRMYKFSRQTGAILWSTDRAGNWLRTFEAFGNDILLAGPLDGTNKTLALLSGTDGSELWSTTLFSGDGTYFGFYRVDAQHVVFSSELNNAKIDVNTGAAAWTAANAPYGCTFCYGTRFVTLANGDALSALAVNSTPVVRRFHNDGSGTVEQWVLSPASPILSQSAHSALLTPSGNIELTVRRSLLSTWISLQFIARFDPTTGTVLGQQLVSASPLDAGSQSRYWYSLAWPTDGSLLTHSTSIESPSPATTGLALLDSSVLASGDLSASLTVDSTAASPGQEVGFHMTVNYTGDQPVTSGHLFGYLPWQGGTRSIACTPVNASNCAVDTRFGSVNATFDILPGGSITIDGQVRVIDGTETNYIGVGAFGPTSLSELDTTNNFGRSKVIQSLFKNGFD
jgi:hypothetical protein